MKKLLICFMVVVMALLPTSMVGCKKNDSSTIRLSEVTHSIFYAPLYVDINEGFFEQKGLKIKLSNAGGADKVMTAITSKSADIGLMGPEATIYCHVNGQKDFPIIFGQLTQRDGSFLVSKRKASLLLPSLRAPSAFKRYEMRSPSTCFSIRLPLRLPPLKCLQLPNQALHRPTLR